MSQSVEQDHPSAFDFLRSDIRNAEDFFTRRSGGEVKTLGLRRAFSFIVDESVGLTKDEEAGDDGEGRLMDVLREWLDREPEVEEAKEEGQEGESGEGREEAKAKKEVDDAVFFGSYIPRSLGEVYDPERDIDILKAGKGETLIYAGITKLDISEGKEGADAQPAEAKEVEAVEEVAEEEPPAAAGSPRASKNVRWADEEEDEAEEEEAAAEVEHERKPRGFRHEDRDAKKVSYGASGELTAGTQEGAQRGEPREAQEQDAQGREGALDQEVEWAGVGLPWTWA